MWTVVYIAPNKARAEKLQKALADEGILVMLRGLADETNTLSKTIEILVPESETEEATEIINSNLTL